MKRSEVDGVGLNLSHPDPTRVEWVGQRDVLEQILACWLVVAESDLPLCPRIVGKPGVGKTTLALAAAGSIGQDAYVFQSTMDTRPEDLLVTPVLGEGGQIEYHASPIVTAMIEGAVAVIDEGNRMSEKSWASLAPLLDHRRYVESVVAGIRIEAHPDFRCCVTMNDDASTYELPDYILSRLQPLIEIDFPEKEEELAILGYNIPYADEELLAKTTEFLQRAHELSLDISTRDGIHMIRYILKRQHANPDLADEQVWEESIQKILGEQALDLDGLAEKRDRLKGDDTSSGGLDDFFFDPDVFGPDAKT